MITTTRKIVVSNPGEAVDSARRLFEDANIEWVLASFDCTVGGVMWDGKYGDLLLHRSEKVVGTASYPSITDAKAAIISITPRA